MGEQILKEIIKLIEQRMGKYKTPILRTTYLEEDLGVIGDDAVELLLEYGQKFNVDMSRFNVSKYFTPEGDTILPSLIRSFSKKEEKSAMLTVGDLEKGAIIGYLDEDVINSSKM